MNETKDQYNKLAIQYQEHIEYSNYHQQFTTASTSYSSAASSLATAASMKHSPPSAAATDILKTFDTQFGIQINCDTHELDDPLIIGTRIFKAVQQHTRDNPSPLAVRNDAAGMANAAALEAFISNLNTLLVAKFKSNGSGDNYNDVILTPRHYSNSDSGAKELESWLTYLTQSLLAANQDSTAGQMTVNNHHRQNNNNSNGRVMPGNDVTSNASDSSETTPQNGNHQMMINSNESNNSSSSNGRTAASDLYFAFADKLGQDRVPVLTPNMSQWVDQLLESIHSINGNTGQSGTDAAGDNNGSNGELVS